MKNSTSKAKEIERLEETVAELRQTIDTLKKSSAAQLKQIGENLPEGGFYQLVHTPDGRRYCSYISDRYGRLFQVTNDQIKKDVNVLYHMFLPEYVELVTRLEQESLERLDRFDLEAPMRLPDGQTRWFQWHSKPKRLNDGTCIWDGVCLDITRRKKAEEALRRAGDELEAQVQERTRDLNETNQHLKQEIEDRRKAEESLRVSKVFSQTVLMSLKDHIAVLDRQGIILEVNDSWKQFARENNCPDLILTGSGVSYLDVCRLSSNAGDDTAQAALDGIRSVINGDRERFEMEYPCDSPTEKRWFIMVVVPLKRPEGGVVVAHTDATIRKTAELKLRKAYSEIKRLKSQIEAECTYLHDEIKQVHDYGHIIGESQVMSYVLYSMERIAPTDTTVLILGESGTGKELIARAIHYNSKRSRRSLVKVDCAAMPTNLIESELFGHEKGAFTGAVDKRIGRFELADGATLFLDEIGELPLELQKKLLRVLQDGEYERLGSTTVMHTDVRIIAATNRDLETDVRRGRFREDLWFRLNVLPLSLPPLRDRKEDIPLLVEWIVNKTQRRLGRQIRRIPDAVMESLMNYHWPGNVRELENVIERAMVFSHGDTLQLAAPLVKTTAASPSEPSAAPLKPLAEVERDHILRALESTLWKISGKGGAADLLGINASTLRGRMLKHGIRRPAAHS